MPKNNIHNGNMALNKYRSSVENILNPLDNNYYGSLLFELFETTYLPEYETVRTIRRHFGKAFEVNIKQYEAIQKINKKINILRTDSPSFDDMFEFGTFVKILEKVYMFKNDKDSDFVCDSNIDDMNNRTLVIQCSDCIIKFNLEKKTDGQSNSIDIIVDRLYGKKMKTSYHIENRKSNAKDNTDDMLLNNITMLLREKMADLLALYGNIIVNKDIEEVIKREKIDRKYNKKEVQRLDAFVQTPIESWKDSKYTYTAYVPKEAKWHKDLEWYLKHIYKTT